MSASEEFSGREVFEVLVIGNDFDRRRETFEIMTPLFESCEDREEFFVVDFVILTWIGSQHPTTPYVEIGQIATAFYFAWFLLIVPVIGLFENTTMDIALDNSNKK